MEEQKEDLINRPNHYCKFNIELDGAKYRLDEFKLTQKLLKPCRLKFKLRKDPAEDISGNIKGKDEAFTVEYTCSHPGKTYEQVELSNNTNKSGTHVGKCALCNADVEPEYTVGDPGERMEYEMTHHSEC